MLFAKAHLHVRCMVTHPHLEGLRLSTNIHKVLGALVYVSLNRNSYELHIFNSLAEINLIDHIGFIDLHIHNLRMDIELWLTSICRIGQ